MFNNGLKAAAFGALSVAWLLGSTAREVHVIWYVLRQGGSTQN